MTILITGGTGFIGSNVVYRLVELGHTVVLLKRKETDTWRIKDIKSKLILCDYTAAQDLKNVFKKYTFDGIIHLATKYLKNHADLAEIQEMINVNVTFPALLLELAVDNKVKFFINTGSCAEYKPTTKPITEKSKLQPNNFYAASKLAFEEILKFYCTHNPLAGITLKLFYPYGDKDNRKLITLIMESFIHNQPLTVTKGEQQINFTYIDDIGAAYIQALDYLQKQPPSSYDYVNIGTDRVHSIKELISMIEKLTKKKNNLEHTRPYPLHEVMYMRSDYTKAKNLLGWKPKYDLKAGLAKTYLYYIKNSDPESSSG